MKRETALVKNTIVLFIGTFFLKGVQYLLLPLYTTILTASEYGEVELVNTFVNLLVPIVGLQLDQGVFRFLIDNRGNKEKTKKLVSASVFFVLGSSAIFAIGMGVLNIFINYDYMGLLILNMFFGGISSLLMQISRGLGDNGGYSVSNIINAIVTAVANIFLLLGIGLRAEGLLYGAVVGYIAGIIFLFFKMGLQRLISIKFVDFGLIKKLLKYSLPMVPNSLSWWIFTSSDRIVVANFISVAATGILSVAYKFSTISLLIFNVFNMSLTESISLSVEDKDLSLYYNKIFDIVLNIFVSIGGVLIACMPFLFKLMVGHEFNEAYPLIPIAIAATTFQICAGILGVIYIAKGNTLSIAVSSIMAAVINIIADIALIGFMGSFAAVVSTLLSFFMLAFYRFLNVKKRYIGIKISARLILNLLISFGIVLSIYYIDNIYANIVNILVAVMGMLLFNLRNMDFVLNILKKRKV
ncbi:oligosaccharide flippase family protein [Candidatus Saccharibacteria bacterium]|nr:oligosaccharide flippase family protein [Candidatus Saccharibacteria bacterium]